MAFQLQTADPSAPEEERQGRACLSRRRGFLLFLPIDVWSGLAILVIGVAIVTILALQYRDQETDDYRNEFLAVARIAEEAVSREISVLFQSLLVTRAAFRLTPKDQFHSRGIVPLLQATGAILDPIVFLAETDPSEERIDSVRVAYGLPSNFSVRGGQGGLTVDVTLDNGTVVQEEVSAIVTDTPGDSIFSGVILFNLGEILQTNPLGTAFKTAYETGEVDLTFPFPLGAIGHIAFAAAAPFTPAPPANLSCDGFLFVEQGNRTLRPPPPGCETDIGGWIIAIVQATSLVQEVNREVMPALLTVVEVDGPQEVAEYIEWGIVDEESGVVVAYTGWHTRGNPDVFVDHSADPLPLLSKELNPNIAPYSSPIEAVPRSWVFHARATEAFYDDTLPPSSVAILALGLPLTVLLACACTLVRPQPLASHSSSKCSVSCTGNSLPHETPGVQCLGFQS